MSDQPQPKQTPEQSKSSEQKAQVKPEGAQPPADIAAPAKPAEPPKPTATAEKPEEKPAGVTAAAGNEDTARAVKVPASDQPAPEKPPAPEKSATQIAGDASAAAVPEKPATQVAGAASAAPAPEKPATEPAPAAEKPAPPATEKPAVPASSPTSAPPSPPPDAASGATSTAPLQPPPPEPAASEPAEKPQVAGAASAASAASMQQRCPNCGHRNRPGVLICENCGTNLMTGKSSVAGTRDLLREQQEAQAQQDATAGAKPGTAPLVDPSDLKAVQSAGSTVFEDNMVLRIEIEGGATPILVYPKQEIIFGRRDPTSGGMPDVDLTPYAGYRMGVSRRHSAIRLQDKRLDVSDLGSSNGTFLNGTRLSAHRPYQVRDGDEIRLGQMVMRVFFQTNTGRK